jgi:hypothetical protein
VSTGTPKEGCTTRHRQEAQTSFATCALDSVPSPGSSAQRVDDGRGARRAQGVTELARRPRGAACAVELVCNPTRSRPARARAQICHVGGALTVASAVSWTSKQPAPFVEVEAACCCVDPPLFLPLQILHFLCTESHSRCPAVHEASLLLAMDVSHKLTAHSCQFMAPWLPWCRPRASAPAAAWPMHLNSFRTVLALGTSRITITIKLSF